MRTIEVNIYQFNELSNAAKERARKWYRKGNNDDFWQESVYEDAKQVAKLFGFNISDIYYSGFWSQGDGACCEGTWRAPDVEFGKAAEYASKDTEIHRIAAEFERIAKEFPDASFAVRHSGHYYHEYCTNFQFDLNKSPDGINLYESDLDKIEKELKEAARDFMKWIYRQLEKEYDYQNSDEQIDENILANEYEFTEDGERV